MASLLSKYLIVRDPTAFNKHKHPDFPYPIVYPLVILHCIFKYKMSSGKSDSEIKILLEQAKEVIISAHETNNNLKERTNQNEIDSTIKTGLDNIGSFTKDDFFIIYPIKSPSGIGLTLIDKTDGIYPMIFYAENDTLADKGNRVHALKAVFDTIVENKNFSNFIKIIDKYITSKKEWSEDIQAEIMDQYPERKKLK